MENGKKVNMNPKVGIILVNYNSSSFTNKCVESIINCNYDNFEIIILDNNSERKDFNNLKRVKNKNILIVKNTSNIGFGQANNFGIEKALAKNCDYIFILNNDTKIKEETLFEFVKFTKKKNFDNKNTILSSIILDKNNKIWFNGLFDLKVLNFPKTKDKNKKISEIKREEEIKSEYSTGCCMFFAKEFLDNINWFDKDYFLYFEDFDFSFGKENIVIEKPLIIHEISASSGNIGKERLTEIQAYYYGRNSILFYFGKKKINLFEKIVYLLIGIWIRPILQIRSWKVLKSYFLGLFDGLKKCL